MFNEDEVWEEYIKSLKRRGPLKVEDLEETGLTEKDLDELADLRALDNEYDDSYDGNAEEDDEEEA